MSKIASVSANYDDVEIVIYECFPLEYKEKVDEISKRALRNASYGQDKENSVYGNPKGRELLRKYNFLKTKLKSFEDAVNDPTQTERQSFDILGRIDLLNHASQGYFRIRHRFLEVYRRDIMEDIDEEGYRLIGLGNQAAHHGDAIADVSLYTSRERVDEKVLVEIYGLTSEQMVVAITAGAGEHLRTLNAGGTWRADKQASKECLEAYAEYIKEYKLNPSHDPNNLNTALGRAYTKFWGTHNRNLHQFPGQRRMSTFSDSMRRRSAHPNMDQNWSFDSRSRRTSKSNFSAGGGSRNPSITSQNWRTPNRSRYPPPAMDSLNQSLNQMSVNSRPLETIKDHADDTAYVPPRRR